MNRILRQGMLLVVMVLTACSSLTGQPPPKPVAQLIDYVEERRSLPRQACLNTLGQAHGQLPTQVAKEAALRNDLATNPTAPIEVYRSAARHAGVRQVFPSSTLATDGSHLRMDALNWCGGWEPGDTYDLFVVDLHTGDVWHIGERGVPFAGPFVRWVGDAWAVVTHWSTPAGIESHLEIVVEKKGVWTSIFRSSHPAAGGTPLVWGTQGDPPQFQFNGGYKHLAVTWRPPGRPTVVTEYEWQNDTYTKVDEQPVQP